MILSGVERADSGRVLLDGAGVDIRTPAHAHRLGIGTVFQELSLVPALSVTENILPNRLPTRLGMIQKREAEEKVQEILRELGIELDPRSAVAGLSVASRQLVEIAKALSHAGRILILDEPTSSLTPVEVERLFKVVRGFAQSGGSVLYVSHKLSEVFAIADTITVLRDGCKIGTTPTRETNPDDIVSMMVGRALLESRHGESGPPGKVVLSAQGISSRDKFRDVSFSLREGEIVGFAGVRGAGRTEVAQAIFGLSPIHSGTIEVDGRRVRPRSPREAMSLGLAYVPEDRKDDGLFLKMNVWQNVVSARLSSVSRYGLMDDTAARSKAATFRDMMRIRTASLETPVGNLSGGNQQKVLIAKWLLADAKVLIVDEPTRGVDVGARAEIHELLRDLASRGTAVMVISSDLPELIALSDRICVMHNGRIAGELDAAEADEERIVAYATGVGD
jgi:ABC-type sugar transport system ATPase subunit